MDHPNPESESPLLSNRVILNGTQTPLLLQPNFTLNYRDGAGKDRCINLERELLGVSLEHSSSRLFLRCAVQTSTPSIPCCSPTVTTVRRCFVLQPLSSDDDVGFFQSLFRKLWDFIDSLDRPKRLLVLVNPYGGKKSAPTIFSDTVKPLLEDAAIQFTVEETKYQLHAKELARGLDLTKYDGIVCVSGDGLLVEVVNGLLERDDWKTAIKLPLGVIPAGTGNGMAKSLLDSVGEPCSAINAVLAIIRGHKRPLDVATVSQGNTKYFSVLMLAWGLVADIDIESEKWRWMGSARLDLYAIKRIFHLRKYNGRIHFVPAPDFEDYVDKFSKKIDSIDEVPLCSLSDNRADVQENAYSGPKDVLDTLNWRTVEGRFVSVWIHNVPWGGESTMAAPNAKFSDGYVDVILIRDCPRLGLLSLMTELNNGNHVKSPHVMYFKVKAFVLEPGSLSKDPSRGGIIDCDGEVLARGNGTYKSNEKSLMSYDRLQITVDQALATMFSPSV